MNNNQMNKLGMYLVVLVVLDKFQTLIASVPAFATKVGLMKERVEEIRELAGDVSKGTGGKTEVKRSAASEMAHTVAKLVGLLHAYAVENGDRDLMAQTSVSETAIVEKRDAERDAYAGDLVDLVESHKAEAADWGVTDQKIASARSAVEAAKNSLGDRNETRTQHSGQRKVLESKFDEVDLILGEQIDKWVEEQEDDNPQFYAEYKSARVIRDIAAGRSGNGEAQPLPEGEATPAS